MMETLTRLWRKAPQPAVLQLSRSREADWAELQLPQAPVSYTHLTLPTT